MSVKWFTTLCAVTAVAVLLAVLAVASQPKVERTDLQAVPIFPTLVNDSARLKTVVIRQGGETLSLDWDGKVWRAREYHNYLADPQKVNDLLVALGRMSKVEGKTKDPERYARLDIQDPVKDSKSRQISLIDNAGKDIGSVVLGKRQYSLGTMGNNTYVRVAGDPQVWLASGEVKDTLVIDWLQRGLVDIDAAHVSHVTVTHPGGEKIVVDREGPEGTMMIDNLPKNAGAASDGSAEIYAEILAGLTFDDVAPADQKLFPKDATTTALIEGPSGFQVALEMADIDKVTWVKIKGAAPAAKPADPKVVDMTTDWTKIIGDLNARADGWAFQLSKTKVAPLKARMADLSQKAPVSAPSPAMPQSPGPTPTLPLGMSLTP